MNFDTLQVGDLIPDLLKVNTFTVTSEDIIVVGVCTGIIVYDVGLNILYRIKTRQKVMCLWATNTSVIFAQYTEPFHLREAGMLHIWNFRDPPRLLIDDENGCVELTYRNILNFLPNADFAVIFVYIGVMIFNTEGILLKFVNNPPPSYGHRVFDNLTLIHDKFIYNSGTQYGNDVIIGDTKTHVNGYYSTI